MECLTSIPLQAPPASSTEFKVFTQQKMIADGQAGLCMLTVAMNYMMQMAFD